MRRRGSLETGSPFFYPGDVEQVDRFSLCTPSAHLEAEDQWAYSERSFEKIQPHSGFNSSVTLAKLFPLFEVLLGLNKLMFIKHLEEY